MDMTYGDKGKIVYSIQDMGTETNIQAVCFMETSLEKHYIAVSYGGQSISLNMM